MIVRLLHTPYQAPNANVYAERWIRTVREECLNHLLILNEIHLWRVLKTFDDYYNGVLGGIINDYYRLRGSTPMDIS
jgi:hypothetical protein